jgi:ribose transport system permease protein
MGNEPYHGRLAGEDRIAGGTPASRDSSGNSMNKALRLLASPFLRACLALIFILAFGCVFNGDHHAFFKQSTHVMMLRSASTYGILATGLTLVIISGGIDLSVGSVLGLSAVLFSMLSIHNGWSAPAAIVACLAAGALCGAASGVLVAKFNMQPFIATLAMMVFARGLAKSISGGKKVSTTIENADGTLSDVPLPHVFGVIDSHVLHNAASVVTLIFLACLGIFWLILAWHRWGRHLYAIGSNENTARLCGVNVVRGKILAYAACSLLAAVAGICQAAQEQQGDPEAGVSYELTAIAMVVVGGTSLMGGRGGMGLTLLGILFMGYLDKILSINDTILTLKTSEDSTRLMITGVIIVLAVLTQRRKAEG